MCVGHGAREEIGRGLCDDVVSNAARTMRVALMGLWRFRNSQQGWESWFRRHIHPLERRIRNEEMSKEDMEKLEYSGNQAHGQKARRIKQERQRRLIALRKLRDGRNRLTPEMICTTLAVYR